MGIYDIESLYNSIEQQCLIKNIKKCTIERCVRKHFAKGYCNKHYREKFPKKFEKKKKVVTKTFDTLCKVEGCNRREMSKGFCNAHNFRF